MAPDPTPPSEKKEIGQDTRQREVRHAARRQGSTHAGQMTTTSQRLEGKKQKRHKEKTYVILRTMSRRGSHALVQRKREHVTEVFPVSSLIGHTAKARLQPNSVAIVSRVCLIVKSHQEDGDDSFACDDVIQRWVSHVPTSQKGDDHCAATTPNVAYPPQRRNRNSGCKHRNDVELGVQNCQ